MKTPNVFIREKYGLENNDPFDHLEPGQWLICMREYADYVVNFNK